MSMRRTWFCKWINVLWKTCAYVWEGHSLHICIPAQTSNYRLVFGLASQHVWSEPKYHWNDFLSTSFLLIVPCKEGCVHSLIVTNPYDVPLLLLEELLYFHCLWFCWGAVLCGLLFTKTHANTSHCADPYTRLILLESSSWLHRWFHSYQFPTTDTAFVTTQATWAE